VNIYGSSKEENIKVKEAEEENSLEAFRSQSGQVFQLWFHDDAPPGMP